jgi:hypothetical protein
MIMVIGRWRAYIWTIVVVTNGDHHDDPGSIVMVIVDHDRGDR